MALGFKRHPKKKQQATGNKSPVDPSLPAEEPREDTLPSKPPVDSAPEPPESPEPAEPKAIVELAPVEAHEWAASANEPAIDEPPGDEAPGRVEKGAPKVTPFPSTASDREERPWTAEEAPPSHSDVRTNPDTLALVNSLLRLHAAEDVPALFDAADQLARAHLNGTYLLAFLADRGGSFRLHAGRSGATETLVERLGEILGTDVTTELPAPLRGRMARLWLGEGSGPQTVSLADFWGNTAGDGPCWRAEKMLGITRVAALRLASSEEPLGIALFISVGDVPDAAMLVAVGHHLTVALANLLRVEKARQFGTMDPVRWIPDQRDFVNQLSREVSRARRYGQPVSLVLLVVDNFDALRYDYGWTVANRLLRSISSALSGCLRETDYLGSYGHNGFGVILVQTTAEAVPETASRLLVAAQGVRVLEGEDGAVPRCAVAVASSPEDGGHASTVLLAAESRLLPKRRLSSASA